MFPYSSSPYPSSLFPSSSSSSSSNSSSILFPHFPFLNLDQNASSSNNNNTFFHDPLSTFPYIPLTHHHHHPIIPETLTTNLAVTTENNNNNCVVTTTMPKLHHHDPPPLPPSSGGYGISCLLTKKPAKKDRHSKIYTSQGLRDRRVRLSIEIARKFFDLQDMLGFDKASNTLEWLFSKSKKAIKDLSKSKNNNSNNTTSSSECEDCEVVSHQQGVFSTIDDTTSPNLQQQQQQEDAAKERNNSKLKRGQQKEPACVRANKMKESREKARARARERTSNKICNNNNNNNNNNQQLELKKKFPASASNENNPQFLHNSRSQLVVGGTSEAQRDNNEFNVIEESIVIKRKLKPSLNMASHHNHHHHQNHVIFPKEASFINNNSAATHDYDHSFPANLSPNWDANNNNNGGGGGGAPTGRSNFCAIASMNLSAGLQIFGKSWEECTNPRLH